MKLINIKKINDCQNVENLIISGDYDRELSIFEKNYHEAKILNSNEYKTSVSKEYTDYLKISNSIQLVKFKCRGKSSEIVNNFIKKQDKINKLRFNFNTMTFKGIKEFFSNILLGRNGNNPQKLNRS